MLKLNYNISLCLYLEEAFVSNFTFNDYNAFQLEIISKQAAQFLYTTLTEVFTLIMSMGGGQAHFLLIIFRGNRQRWAWCW